MWLYGELSVTMDLEINLHSNIISAVATSSCLRLLSRGHDRTIDYETVASQLGWTDRTIAKCFKIYERHGSPFVSAQGQHCETPSLLDDENVWNSCKAWLQMKKKHKKGHPHDPDKHWWSVDFMMAVNDEILPKIWPEKFVLEVPEDDRPKISQRTAIRWLHRLGKVWQPGTKHGAYKDKHDDPTVVKYRDEEFIPELRQLLLECEVWLGDTDIDEIPMPNDGVVPTRLRQVHSSAQAKCDEAGAFLLAIHDESTYHANDDVEECWDDKGELEMRAKSRGKGIMV